MTDMPATDSSQRAPALSPSRAADFLQCALLYRLRAVDRLQELPSVAQSLGTLLHTVLEDLFDAPPRDRTLEHATAALEPTWRSMVAADARLEDLVASDKERRAFFTDARARLGSYFLLENPSRLEPHAREQRLDFQLDGGPLLRGIIDRVDVAADGSIRIVDYKSGASPRAGYGKQAEFQMRFYALLAERVMGRRPALLRLLYLRDGATKELVPTDADLEAVEFEARSIWEDIERAARSGTFRPSKSRLCAWCAFQEYCPEFGGKVPALDPVAVEAATGVRPDL